ncbi:glycosyltransferase [Treponema pedis]|uniref:Glycosyltransferase n=2 Tax=Treponema pedis TaxID=409322 RepID=A0A7S6WM63_9SPIR|nr:glycosyltransferase [Treponema pedis]QOW59723.1 glycosyltransferase [Treponema pedis]
MKQNQVIGFLYLPTGAGHLSGARALSEYLTESYPNEVECKLKNGFTEKMIFSKLFFERGYSATSNYFEKGYVAFYQLTSLNFSLNIFKKIFAPFFIQGIVKFIKENKITKLVCTHEILIVAAREAINRTKKDIPLISIVMDPFTAHPIWFYEKNTDLIVFSEKLKNEAIQKYKFNPDRIHKFPIMLSRNFDTKCTQEEKIKIKKLHGIPEDKKIVLIAGGGEGLKKAVKIVHNFIRAKTDSYLIAVCGKNKELKYTLEYLAKLAGFKNIKILGFVPFMKELMNIADCIITKSGPATIMEALLIGKPLILSTYVRGQEWGNLLYVTQNHAGWYIPEPKKIVKKTQEIFSDDSLLNEICSKIENMDIKNGLKDIAEFIYNF